MGRGSLIGVVLIVIALALAFAVLFAFTAFDEREGPMPGEPPIDRGQITNVL